MVRCDFYSVRSKEKSRNYQEFRTKTKITTNSLHSSCRYIQLNLEQNCFSIKIGVIILIEYIDKALIDRPRIESGAFDYLDRLQYTRALFCSRTRTKNQNQTITKYSCENETRKLSLGEGERNGGQYTLSRVCASPSTEPFIWQLRHWKRSTISHANFLLYKSMKNKSANTRGEKKKRKEEKEKKKTNA